MNKTIQISVRNSDLTTPKDKRAFLTYPAEGLANCVLKELEDGVSFIFETEGLEQSEIIFSKSKKQQLRFLINCAALEKLYDEYEFSLSADNLMIDINLLPKILLRDARNGNGSSRNIGSAGNVESDIDDNKGSQGFLSKYKALIGSFLLHRYKYEDFIKGGSGLYKKNKLLLEISKMPSVDDIKSLLTEEYHKTIRETDQNQISIPKRNMLIFKILTPSLALALIATSFFAITSLLNDIPYRDHVIMANQAYIAGNHMEVQRVLDGFAVQRLTHETRHILSRSYVATEPLSDAQRNNILMGLTLITDTSIFDYWIHLGRLEFDDAIDIALRFGDNELLLFAYIRQEAFVRADPHMPGSEKVMLLSYLEGRIDALQRDRENVGGLLILDGDNRGVNVSAISSNDGDGENDYGLEIGVDDGDEGGYNAPDDYGN